VRTPPDLPSPLTGNERELLDRAARLLQAHEQTEAALRLSEERLRTAVDAGQIGIWEWEIPTNRITWSDRVYDMHGRQRGEDPGGVEAWRRSVHPDDQARVQAALQHALATGEPYAAEFRRVLPDGSVRWTHTRAHVVRDAAGQPLRLVGATIDVTERMELLAAERRARSEAEAARRRMELLAAAGEQLAGSLDPQETLLAVARTLVPTIADWCRIDLLDDGGQPRREIAFHVDAQRAAQALEVARALEARPDTTGSMSWVMRTGRPVHGDFGVVREDTDPAIHAYTSMFGMREHFIIPLVARGRTVGGMAVVQAESGRTLGEEDRALILELGRRAALALDNSRLFAQAEAARAHAERANRAKDEFLAMLGHELRNPLAPIATALEVMQRRWPDTAAVQRQVIRRQVNHLSRLIDDLLDISRITSGKIELRSEPVDLQAVVANAIELTRPLFDRHAEPVAVDVTPEPLLVQGDFVRLSQVLANLLVNAAKFTPPDGRVRVRLQREGSCARLDVEDSGCGIAPDLLPRVFDLFVQGGQPIDRSHGGLGLGLAIVRSLVGLHGGSVDAHSGGEGRGARFTVRLPLDEATGSAPMPLEQEPAPASGSGRILVVDDNADAALTLADLLEVLGYEVRTAGDAESALAVLDGFRPHLGLLDIGLPRVDGYELARMIRSRPDGAGLKLVALTGYGQESDRQRAREAGFDEHLVKPVDIDRLTEIIQSLLR
jgi:PAS domain S-box-containing protein